MSKQTQADIRRIAKEIGEMVVAKNVAYGDSAVDPVRIFSKASPVEQILVRLDDKISRLQRGTSYPGDNEIDDIMGYLILLKIAKERYPNEQRLPY
jgi:hypothetical protein